MSSHSLDPAEHDAALVLITPRRSEHSADAIGWADFFQRSDLLQLLKAHAQKT